MKKIVAFLIFTVFAGYATSQNIKYSKIKIYLDETKNIRQLVRLGINLQNCELKQDIYLVGEFSERDIELLQKNDFKFETALDEKPIWFAEKLVPLAKINIENDYLDGANLSIVGDSVNYKIIYFDVPPKNNDVFCEVYNTVGQVIFKQFTNPQHKWLKINTQKWKPGIYFYQIKTNQKVFQTKKLVILH